MWATPCGGHTVALSPPLLLYSCSQISARPPPDLNAVSLSAATPLPGRDPSPLPQPFSGRDVQDIILMMMRRRT